MDVCLPQAGECFVYGPIRKRWDMVLGSVRNPSPRFDPGPSGDEITDVCVVLR